MPFLSSDAAKMGTAAFIGFAVACFSVGNLGELSRLRAELDSYKRLAKASGADAATQISAKPNGSVVRPVDHTTQIEGRIHKLKDGKERNDEQLREDFVNKTSGDRSNEYSQVFSELHLSPEQAREFREKLANIHKESLICEGVITKLMESRNKYVSQMRDSVSPENFAKYQTYEETKPAIRELGLIQEYLKESQRPVIEPASQEAVIAIIKAAAGNTAISWEGPFDGLPQPVVGQDAVIAWQEQEIARQKEVSKVIQEQARNFGLSDETRELLSGYYQHRIKLAEKGLELLQVPPEEQFDSARRIIQSRNSSTPRK